VLRRDRQDSERAIAPLRPSDDGVLVDSTGKTIDEVVEEMLGAVRRKASKAL
jgi:cytidylate kinase